MDVALEFIQKLGFPVFVAVFLMFKYDRKMERLLEEHKRTNVVLAVLVKVISDGSQSSGVPQEVIDEVSGVETVPLPPGRERDT